MSLAGQSGSVRRWSLSFPLLLECDWSGHILWMSEQAQTLLGPVQTLTQAVPRWIAARGSRAGSAVEFGFACLLEFGGTLLIGIRAPQLEEPAGGIEIALLRLQGRLSLHYFRLLRVERHLSERADRGLRRGGAALRQVELERQRLGRELHTGIGQQLTAIRQQTELIAMHFPTPDTAVQQALNRISALTADALDQVRSVSQRLHPPDWQRLPLDVALRQLWDLSGIPQRFAATLRIGALSRDPDPDAKVLIYRAAQEAFSNLTRHSGATRVEAALVERAGSLVLTVLDNGAGFDAQVLLRTPASVTDGIGLRSIREQAAAAGGKLVVDSGPAGTKLEISVPFAQPE